MKLIRVTAAALLLAATAAAQAEISSTVTLTSDYDFRGITQTAKDPALQLSVDWAGESGLYVGAWGSNVDFGDCCDENLEVDVYAGYAGGEEVTYDVGLVYYFYPGADSIHFGELYGELGWQMLTGKLWYSPDFANADESAYYIEGNANFELPANFGLGLHIGYSDGDYWDELYDGGYMDWSVGLTYTLGNFDLGLKYTDGSDLDDLDDFCRVFPADCVGIDKDVFSTDGRVVFSVSTTFPWAKE
jgi:uncharacterized protein (TIGR02001 family)